MTPAQAIAALDRQLAANGEDAVLPRYTLAAGNQQVPTPVKIRVQTQGYQPHELIQGSGILQGDVKVILSPTQINAAQWPGGSPVQPGAYDPRIPNKGDRFVIGGHPFTVQGLAAVRRVNGEIVRMEAQCRG